MNSTPLAGSTRALISLGAFRHNLGSVRSYAGEETRVMAVVKANAYGHGMIEIAREAVRAGVDALAVARVTEALNIRRSGIGHPILVFEIPPEPLVEAALAEGIELSVSTAGGAASISRRASQSGLKALVHVKVDTGMGRLGFPDEGAPSEIASLLRLPRIELAGLYSHFATSEDADTSFALGQVERFNRVIDRLRALGIEPPLRHMANSGAVITLPGARYDMVRPGIMLYGYPPSRGMPERFPVVPVMSLLSSISMLRSVGKGTSISYGRRFIAPAPTTIATVPAGYADGYSRLLTNRASAIIRGSVYPVVGTICMDHIMIDVGPDPQCQAGDDVTLIGADGNHAITAWDIAETLGTIPYEVTCLVSERVPRLFVE
ncbi:MAG TPA: alanine racemase [Bacteroidota bacterium]|nr:alanine racemase [Bacteroidota bacterium]